MGGKSVDFKGKNANIRGGHHTLPPSPLSASGTGGGVVLWCPPPKTAFYVMKTRLLPPTELCGALWWACGAHWWLNYLVDNLFPAIPHIHLFSGYLFTLKQRGNSVLAIIGAHPPKLLDQTAMRCSLECGGFGLSAAIRGMII